MSETLSTLAGGNGGHAFTISIPTGAVLKAIHLFAGDYVDGLQLVVGDAAGHEMTLPPAGGTGGSAATFELADDEVLAGISGRFGWYVDNIQFHTNKRTSPLYGGLGGEHTFYIPVPADQVVAGVYGREYGTAWLASMTTVLIAAAGRESDDVGVAVRYAAFSAEDAEFAHSWVVDDQRATVEAYQLTANGRVPPFSSPADRPRFHPFTADQLIDQGAFSNS